MSYLSIQEIYRLTEAVLSGGLNTSDARDDLLSNINRGYVATLPRRANTLDQIKSDLVEMNEVSYLMGNEVPLEIWLQNGVHRLRRASRPEQALFQQILNEVSPKSQTALAEAGAARTAPESRSPLHTTEGAEVSMGRHFLSYSKANARSFAIELSRILESGSPAFSILMDDQSDEDSDIISWHQELEQAIRSSESLLFVMSRESVTEPSVGHIRLISALKYKKPIIPLRLHAEAATPFLLGSRHCIDFSESSRLNASLAELRNDLQRLSSPAGVLRSFKDRLADAERDLACTRDEMDGKRIGAEISLLKPQIAEQQKIVDHPKEAQERANESIASGLKNERLGSQPISPSVAKFINPPPGLAPSYFQNRVIETQLVGDFLKDDTKRLLRIVGRGGVGKTAMVCRVLNSLEDGRLPEGESLAIDGIVYGSEPITFPALFADLVQLLPDSATEKMDGIYKNPQAAVEMKMKALLSAFPKGRVVVLLDSFENVVDPDTHTVCDMELAEALRTFLRVARHGIKLILTTRVAPRDLALVEPGRQMPIELDQGLESPYAENILRAMDADGTLGLRDAPNDSELLREARQRTLGFPRALEALFAILSVDRYTTLREVLNDAAKLLPDNVVEVLVGEAFSRLDAVKQKIIETLAIYNRPVTIAAVNYLLQPYLPGFDSKPLLYRLINARLVRKEGERYYLHRVDREYAFARLPPGEVSDACDMSSPPFTQFALLRRGAESFRQARKPPELWKTIADLSAQLAETDLRCQAADWNTAASVLLEIDYQLELWGHYRLTVELYEHLLDRLSDTQLKAVCQVQLGGVFYRVAEYEKGVAVLKNALAGSREVCDHSTEASAQLTLAACYGDMGKTRAAIEQFDLALGNFQDLGQRVSEGTCLNNLAFFLADLGQTKSALECHENSLQIALDIPDPHGATIYQANKGARLNELGFRDKAIECCQKALVEAQKLGYRYSESVNLVYLGDCFADRDDWKEAIALYDKARTIAVEIGNPQFEIHALIGLAEAYLFSDDLLQARCFVDEADKYCVPRTSYEVLVLRGIVALRRSESQAAHEAFVGALEQSDRILLDMNAHAKALYNKGLALCGLALSGGPKNFVGAAQAFHAARVQCDAPGVITRVLRRLNMLASRYPEAIPPEVRLAVAGATTENGK